jgi:RHS repeat-associated protein
MAILSDPGKKIKNDQINGYSGDPYTTGTASTTDTEVPSGWPQEIVYAPAGGPPGAPIQYGDTITNETVDAGFGYIGSGAIEETQRYFFHSDHLGSTSYVTDASGNVNQYIAYLPFGETFVEGHSDWDSPYKFNAKEYDSETGLYFYGARYYDPKISRFVRVDPLAEKYSNISSYVYCANNPIRLIDPTGMDFTDPDGNNVKAGENIESNKDASKIYNTGDEKNKNWDYGTWNKNMNGEGNGGYELHYTNNSSNDDNNNSAGGGVPNWVGTAIGAADATAGAFETAYTVQAGQTLRYGQRVNGVVRSANTLTRANRISSLSTARTFSRAGTGLTVLSAGVTVVDGLTNDKGWQNHHTADLLVTGAIYGTAAAFPVVGWVVGGLYFAADLTTQYYTGKSITQNLFDQ